MYRCLGRIQDEVFFNLRTNFLKIVMKFFFNIQVFIAVNCNSPDNYILYI